MGDTQEHQVLLTRSQDSMLGWMLPVWVILAISACSSPQIQPTDAPPSPTIRPSSTETLPPPSATPEPSPTPPPPTPSVQSVESYLDSYCGPELISFSRSEAGSGADDIHQVSDAPSANLICNSNETYYFTVAGLDPDEFIFPFQVLAIAPEFGALSVLVSSSLIADEEGSLVVSLGFEGLEPAGEWEMVILRPDKEDVTTTFMYAALFPGVILTDTTIGEDGTATYVLATTGWQEGEALRMSGDSPNGEFGDDPLGTANAFGIHGLFRFPSLPTDPPDGNYSIRIEGDSGVANYTITCQSGVCAPSTALDDANELYGLGIEEYESSNYEQAVELFSEAVELDLMHDRALNMLAWTLLFQLDTRYEEAFGYAERALELRPDNQVHDTLAMAYFKLEAYERALFHYNIALIFDPRNDSSYRDRGHVYVAMGDFEAAIQDYEQYLDLEPEAPDRSEIEAKIDEISGS